MSQKQIKRATGEGQTETGSVTRWTAARGGHPTWLPVWESPLLHPSFEAGNGMGGLPTFHRWAGRAAELGELLPQHGPQLLIQLRVVK